jgi:8-oxo-dGTP pyrophosphatase MutT (NUDIX family)
MKRQHYQYSFCNNCGKYGSHTYSTCKHPITSIGIVAFRERLPDDDKTKNSSNTLSEKSIEYLMIRRKDTLGFVDFIRGKYQLFDRSHIRNLIDEMTVDEKHRILTQDFKQLWCDLWGLSPDNMGHHQHCGEESHSRDKFQHLKNGVKSRAGPYCLSDIVNKSTTKWVHSEWGFPKGRRNNQERDIVCALRESLEETGYVIDQSDIIQNVVPYEEIFMGSNLKCYKHKYFLAFVNSDTTPIKDYDRCEVSKIKWMPYEECLRKIRPYNVEKKKMLRNIRDLITTHEIYN